MPLRTSLVALKDAVERQAADLHNMALRAFEVALTASSGFWITLGLLASWSIRDHAPPLDLARGREHTPPILPVTSTPGRGGRP